MEPHQKLGAFPENQHKPEKNTAFWACMLVFEGVLFFQTNKAVESLTCQ